MNEDVVERLTQLEGAVRRAGETLARLREDNDRLRREVKRLEDERRQVLGQVDAIIKDIGKLDLEGGVGMAAGRVELTLLGQTLTVRTEAPPEYVRRLAAYLEERVATLTKSGVKDPTAALTLAALDITDELFRARDDQTKQDGDVGTRLSALVEILDRLAPGPPPRRT